jgi:superfamily I DNA/RNA helicase
MDDEATYEWDWFEALFKTPEHAAHAADLNLEWFAKSLIEGKAKSYQLPLQIIRQNNTAAILRQDPHVVVGTIHSIKGGEADVVAVYPDLSMRGYEQWAGEGRHRDSIVRQFYVAVTRARQHLLLPCQETKLFFPI